MEGMVIGGGHSDAEAYALSHARHAGDHRHHVVTWPLSAVAHRRVMIAAVVLRRAARVPEEQHIHDTARRHAGDVFVKFWTRVVGIALPGAGHLPEIVGVIMRQVDSEMNQL